VKKFISWLIRRAKPSSEGIEPPRPPHSDYSTPEYTVKEHISKRKWECVRGIGKSFGYNAEEKESDFLTGDELIHMLIDIVSKNGNLLLNIGPKKDGSIPDVQIDRLKSLGRWLGVNGNGIFETRPWLIATTKTECGLDIRFTAKENLLYIFILGQPKTDLIKFSLDDTYRKIILEQEAELLGGEATTVQVIGEQISLTANWLNSSAQCLKLKV
ncbi:MAG: alpha-L-fucosidase, partial [Pseudomonadales bacterium]|nr:alpha-L-fucosidase [Pseudomonadales bacterium]